MRIKLKRVSRTAYRNAGYVATSNQARNVGLCAAGLRRQIHLPANCKEITAVFTKSGPLVDKFTITKPRNMPSWGSRLWYHRSITPPQSRVKETQAQLSTFTERLLARAYERGYRYVHFEY